MLNPLPNNKMLDTTKLKTFADENLNVAKMPISLFDREENTVEKGENAGNPLPNDKSLDKTKLKAFADETLNIA